MKNLEPKVARCHLELLEIIDVLRAIEISTESDQRSSLPQTFDFAIQRMEGLATFVDFICKSCTNEKNSLTEGQIFLPLEISRKNLLLIEMDEACQNDVQIF
ncbi:hypothetical protein [Donghicola tyrosinivorans]|uniref:hypothetical protein n=1 Tax=Donghicola tyrosinivorans TaxID=1652492 RepID=UPI000D06475B|nr:hypothetical protein [Donghicola tyrosinivorans]